MRSRILALFLSLLFAINPVFATRVSLTGAGSVTAPGPSFTAIGSHVQPNATTPVSFTTTSAVPAGSLVVIAVNVYSTGTGASSAVSDAGHNTYSVAVHQAGTATGSDTAIFYVCNSAAIPSGTVISTTFSSPVTAYPVVIAGAYIADTTASCLDASNKTTNTTGSPTISATPTTAPQYIIGVLGSFGFPSGTPVITESAGFTQIFTDNSQPLPGAGNMAFDFAWKQTATATLQTYAPSPSVPTFFSIVIATFK